MSGVAVIVAKLRAYAPLVAVVPAVRIVAGDLPLKSALPAISVMQVSSVPRLVVAMPIAKMSHTDRVQVTVLVKGDQIASAGTGYAGLRTILAHVLAACPHTRGTFNGVSVDTIMPDSEGPDDSMDDPYMLLGSRDFMVRWIAP